MNPLLLLQSFSLNKAVHTASTIVIITLVTFIYKLHVQVTEAKLVYSHPDVVIKTNTVRVEGPVRIVTRIVELKDGEKETTITEDHAPVVEKVDVSSSTIVVPLSVALEFKRSDRYLLGAGLLDFSPNTYRSYRMYGGYSIANRVDFLYGIGIDGGIKQSVSVIFRF